HSVSRLLHPPLSSLFPYTTLFRSLDFLDFVEDRRRQYPDLHIYHYASYERSHLTSIAQRHGVGEDRVDKLLKEHVLVDLYSTVRSEEHTSELQSRFDLVCRLLLEK